MAAESVELRPTLDRDWLEAAARADPVAHAYALWDLDHEPDRIRVVSAVLRSTTLGYLLIWIGNPAGLVVHWVGEDPRLEVLAGRLPARPLIAIVPEPFVAAARDARGPVREFPVLSMIADAPSAGPIPEREVRRLKREDRARLVDWAGRQESGMVDEYPALDPDREEIWGAFDGDRLLGVCRAAVRRPDVWILGGVFVETAARGEGWGRSLVATALRAAAHAGAPLALYVREDRTPARLLYESLGFRPIGRRVWIDAGSGVAP